MGELLITRRVLSTMENPEETVQQENIFHMRYTVNNKVFSLIIDGGSCTNVDSKLMVDKLGLTKIRHPRHHKLRWLNNSIEFKISEQVTISFSVGRYHDQVLYDDVPMKAGHILLGRAWHFDREVTYDGCVDLYSFMHDKLMYTLAPLTPAEVHELQVKMSKDIQVSKTNIFFYVILLVRI